MNVTAKINSLFDKESWAEAREILQDELKKTPDSHWLHDRLSVTYYEERRYAKALKEIKIAYELMPTCPLVLWDYAGTLDALGQSKDAIGMYLQIIKEFTSDATEACWESERWGFALSLDCFFRMGVCLKKIGNLKAATRCLATFHRIQIRSNISELYTVEQARQLMDEIETHEDASNGVDSLRATMKNEAKRVKRELAIA